MLNKKWFFSLFILSPAIFAAQAIDLYQAPLSSLNHFPKAHPQTKFMHAKTALVPQNNSLQQVNQTSEKNATIIRYQQLYKGIPVIGAQVIITQEKIHGINGKNNELVNGHLLNNIQININPQLNKQQALDAAKKFYLSANPQANTEEESSELQIRAQHNDELKLVYLVSFKVILQDEKPMWPFFIIDAQTGEITKQWDNIKNYLDTGPGGNEKTQQYWYGKDGLPSLNVTQQGNQCVFENEKVKLVNLSSIWDWGNLLSTPHEYPCNNNIAENINGAFSPANDAYYFGHVIVDMYRDWYGLNALQHDNGVPMKLVMRVHFGQNFDNAFWDGQTMSFGDGQIFYPLVSLDIAGHEVTHGFTQQHSGLEYHDQSGAINEAVSDMAGQTSRAYLLEKTPQLYKKAYLQSNEVTWGIGETIVRESFGKAMRYMDFPSSDGDSADCLDKNLALQNGAHCAISYNELIEFAKINFSNPFKRQSFIVHTASGIFNKAFYLLSKRFGIKTAYHMMLLANTKYWTPDTDFKAGACGVIYSAKELQIDINPVKKAFNQVGIDTINCAV